MCSVKGESSSRLWRRLRLRRLMTTSFMNFRMWSSHVQEGFAREIHNNTELWAAAAAAARQWNCHIRLGCCFLLVRVLLLLLSDDVLMYTIPDRQDSRLTDCENFLITKKLSRDKISKRVKFQRFSEDGILEIG